MPKKSSIRQSASRIADKFTQQGGRALGNAVAQGGVGGPLGVSQGLSSGLLKLFGMPAKPAEMLGTALGAGLLSYGVDKLHQAQRGFSLTDYITKSPEQRQNAIKTNEDEKWQKKIKEKMQISGDFQPKDLDTYYTKGDEGWRSVTESMDWDEYSKVASEAVKNNDPVKIWNAVARKAIEQGKKIKRTDPLYLPNTFTKNGKQYAYAIDASDFENLRFVPIAIGGGAFPVEE